MADIFLSYDDKDRDRARALVTALERQGWSIFWDRSIPAGKTWWQAIGRALKSSRSVVVLWSRTAVQSTWVYEEADDGRKRGILVPVFIDPVLPPIGLRSVQAVDLSGWDGSEADPAFQKLLADVSAVIDAEAGIAPAVTVPELEKAVQSRHLDRTNRARAAAADKRTEDDEYSSSRFYLLLTGLALGSALALYLWG